MISNLRIRIINRHGMDCRELLLILYLWWSPFVALLRWYECRECDIQYIPRNMHTVFALRCFVVVIHWLIFPYPSGLLHWHCGNLTIAPVPAKQPWWIWINTSCEIIMNDCITTTKQSTTKPCAYFLGYTVFYKSGTIRWLCLRQDDIIIPLRVTFQHIVRGIPGYST